METGILVLGAALGRAVIPIPIEGRMMGGFAASTLVTIPIN
ncbi:hypothetical protein ABE288_05955 [Bacillus salipaludis]